VGNTANKPGKGLLGWLGRQVGYVRQAVKTDVTAPTVPPPIVGERKLYENTTVHESPHPTDPNVKLRRTVIDEAVQTPGDPQKSKST
jgi:hypothetical protein